MANINSKSTKAQILAAYKELQKQNAQIQKQLDEGKKTSTSSPSQGEVKRVRHRVSVNNTNQNLPMNSTTTNINQIIQMGWRFCRCGRNINFFILLI